MKHSSLEKHQHSGKSSKGLLTPEEILKQTSLKTGDCFLDAGCGEGHFSIVASGIVGKNGKVFAFDIYREGIEHLKKEIKTQRLKNINAFVGDITQNIPVGDVSVDVCLLSDVLHGLVANRQVDASFTNISRVLKKGGLLVVIEFKKIDGLPGPPISVRLTPERTEEAIIPFGFKKQKMIEAGHYHYGVVYKKSS